MASKGYTTQALVEAELGRALTSGEGTAFSGLLEEVEADIDARHLDGGPWLRTAPIVESHVVTGPYLFLQTRPVTSITSITVRAQSPGSASTTLTSGADYELIDAATGALWLSPGYRGFLATTTYTPSPAPGPAVPADVREAATLLLADRFTSRANAPTTAAVAAGISGYRIGPDLEVRFNTSGSASSAGSAAAALSPRTARAEALLSRHVPLLAFA
jgi:hypothetical protein